MIYCLKSKKNDDKQRRTRILSGIDRIEHNQLKILIERKWRRCEGVNHSQRAFKLYNPLFGLTETSINKIGNSSIDLIQVFVARSSLKYIRVNSTNLI